MNKYHVSFSYQTAGGNFGSATYIIKAKDHSDAFSISRERLHNDKRRKVSRLLMVLVFK